ncbi:hypothetical protein HJFPF1_12336 [Paramyrothecium foliicola]|nr:hypothetical protein HJFPF1_12336 [Paramyrothecium foliicola]
MARSSACEIGTSQPSSRIKVDGNSFLAAPSSISGKSILDMMKKSIPDGKAVCKFVELAL